MIRRFCIIATSVLLFASCGSRTETNNSASTPDSVLADAVENDAPERMVTLAFTGDVMMGTSFPQGNFITPDRGKSLFLECRDILSAADAAIVNLEGTCYDGAENQSGKTAPTRFYFRMPADHAQNLTDAGIDIVNFANNHSFDFGMEGRKKTIENIRAHNVGVSGIRDLAEGCVIERSGIRIGYVSFAAACTMVNDLNDSTMVLSLLRKYREQCDILAVGFHGGAEGTDKRHLPRQQEFYLGENRGDVYAFAHMCIDNGADIVVGHGPHVPRAMELYKGHLIAYSLGNFCTPFRMSIYGATGFAPLLVARLSASGGTLMEGNIHSYIQQKGAGPKRDKGNSAAREISVLTREDFPDTRLSISDNGKITVK